MSAEGENEMLATLPRYTVVTSMMTVSGREKHYIPLSNLLIQYLILRGALQTEIETDAKMIHQE